MLTAHLSTRRPARTDLVSPQRAASADAARTSVDIDEDGCEVRMRSSFAALVRGAARKDPWLLAEAEVVLRRPLLGRDEEAATLRVRATAEQMSHHAGAGGAPPAAPGADGAALLGAGGAGPRRRGRRGDRGGSGRRGRRGARAEAGRRGRGRGRRGTGRLALPEEVSEELAAAARGGGGF